MKDKGQRSLHLLGLEKRKRWRVLSLVYSPEHVALLCLPGTKAFVMPNGMLKSNQQLVDIIEKVKPEIRLLIEKCNTVKMWVQLLIPRIEDGNNFGVSIQEETVAELSRVKLHLIWTRFLDTILQEPNWFLK